MTDTPLQVVHNERAHRFEAQVAGGVAHTDYRRVGSTLEMVHTEVPPEAAGGGVAGAIVKAALDYAAANQLTVRPVCTYVRGYMQRHPQTQALLAPGASL